MGSETRVMTEEDARRPNTPGSLSFEVVFRGVLRGIQGGISIDTTTPHTTDTNTDSVSLFSVSYSNVINFLLPILLSLEPIISGKGSMILVILRSKILSQNCHFCPSPALLTSNE